jgi:queuosine precursor transporter
MFVRIPNRLWTFTRLWRESQKFVKFAGKIKERGKALFFCGIINVNNGTMKQYKYLGIITALYITFQLVSDVTAGKIVQLGIFTVSVTVLYFPFTYIFADVLTEVYGYAKARSVVWVVLFSSVIAGLIYTVVVYLPPAVGFNANDAYTRVLGQIPRILVGGWIAVWAGGILNDYVLAKMKIWTQGKYLWTRTIGSTIVGEGVNTALFYFIALYAVIPANLLFASILSGWFLKVVVEVVLTPLTYIVVNKLKSAESEDYYDKDTNFNPLIIK